MRTLTRTVTVAAIAVLGAQIAAGQGKPVRTIKEGVLDQIKLYVEKPPSSTRVAMKLFSTDDIKGDSDDTKKMKVDAPSMLANSFVLRLKALGPYTDAAPLGGTDTPAADALVVDGKFTEMDPGSRAARVLVGFGAGKSGVTVTGSVKTAGGMLLAEFEQRRIGAMGSGDSIGKLTSDTRDIGEDIAKFLSAWAKDQKLK